MEEILRLGDYEPSGNKTTMVYQDASTTISTQGEAFGNSSFSKNVDFAGRMVYNDKGEEMFNFGKYKGQLVKDVLAKDPSYYAWMMNSDFTLNTKAALTRIRVREMMNK